MADVLYATHGGSGATDTNLYIVTVPGLSITAVGDTGHFFTGLAVDPTDTTKLYGVTGNLGADQQTLFLIDMLTAGVTLIGALGTTIADISFKSTGQLLGFKVSTRRLVTIDKATAAVVEVGPSGLGSASGNGLAVDPNSDAAAWLFPQASNGDIFTMDTATGAATDLGVLLPNLGADNSNVGAASFGPLDVLYGVATSFPSTLFTVGPPNGFSEYPLTSLGNFPDMEPWDGLAWSLSGGPTPPPPTPVFGRSRYQETPPWRMIVGDLEDKTLTFLDRLALDRSVTVTRAAARVISGRVPSDNPEVNIPAPAPDSEAFLSEGARLVSCFRREAPSGSGEPPWVIRARGIVLSLTDDADSDHATSTFTAYDPWKYWYRRPILNDVGAVSDFSYVAGTRADEIILDQFSKALAFGDTIFTDFGQTLGFYTGTIEATEPLADGGDGLAMTFRAGTTLGEMCDLLVATGTCDIVNDPIYDIANRPGLLTQTSIYRSAGEFRANAVMGWDRWPRSLVQLSRQVEGTERANEVQMYAGQGGPAVSLQTDAASLARFGEYWALQYLPGVPSLAGAHLIAQRQLALLKDGQYTYTLSPASERAPLLFEEYREADTVPVYASDRFRDPISGVPVRVESIPIVIGDDEQERVNQILVSFAPESGS
jgi:hypothetical protein